MVRVESSSKRKIAEENYGGGQGIDRLSTLPDSILLHILSFLPTETTVQTVTLVSQSLRGAFHLNVQHSSAPVLFPSLKILILDISCMGSLDALLSGCPVLQTLKIINRINSISKVCVPPSLKTIEVSGGVTCLYLEINAPGLQYLTITNYCESQTFNSVVGNLQNVEEAYINVFSPPGESESVNPLHNLLGALCGVKKLVLLYLTTQSLFCAPVLDFPEFRYLLILDIALPSFNSNFLVNMLENCPMLQDLMALRDEQAPPGGTWELQSTKVPNCLVSHLTSVEIGMFRGIQDELLEFAEYILLNGLILKTMLIVDNFELDLEEKNYILKRLSDIPRVSAMCQIEFI